MKFYAGYSALFFAACLLSPGSASALSSEAEEFIRLLEKTAPARCELKGLEVKLHKAEKASNRDLVSSIIIEMKKITASFDSDARRMMALLPGLTKSSDFPAVVERQQSLDSACK